MDNSNDAPITLTLPSGANCEIMEIVLRNSHWPITFHTITTRDVNGWCRKWRVRVAPHAPITPTFRQLPDVK